MAHPVYDSPLWVAARAAAVARDRNRCAVSRLVGGGCSAVLHVHHVESVDDRPDLAFELDNLVSVCSRHHPTLEALRRRLRREREWRTCSHHHRTREGRRQCEERLNRGLVAA